MRTQQHAASSLGESWLTFTPARVREGGQWLEMTLSKAGASFQLAEVKRISLKAAAASLCRSRERLVLSIPLVKQRAGCFCRTGSEDEGFRAGRLPPKHMGKALLISSVTH